MGGGGGPTMAVSNIVPKSALGGDVSSPEDFDQIQFNGVDVPFLDLAKARVLAVLTKSKVIETLRANQITSDNMGCFVAPDRKTAEAFIKQTQTSNSDRKWVEFQISGD
jgi:hypothetical protein